MCALTPLTSVRTARAAMARVSIIAETLQNIIVVPAVALLNSDEGGQISARKGCCRADNVTTEAD